MKILVTGGTGYVGRELVPELMKKHEVVVLTRRKLKADFETFRGNIANFKDVRAAIKGCDAVVHLAVESNHSKPWKYHYLTTVLGTENVLRAAREESADKVVHVSSAAVLAKTQTNYVRAKVEAEAVVRRYWNDFTVPVLRPSSIYDEERVEMAGRASKFPIPRPKNRFLPVFRTSLVDCIMAALKVGCSKIYHIGDRKEIYFSEFLRAAAFPREPLFLPSVFIFPALLFSRVRFFLEDRVFETDMHELGVQPQDTFETIFKLKFGSDWEEMFYRWERPGQDSNLRPPGFCPAPRSGTR